MENIIFAKEVSGRTNEDKMKIKMVSDFVSPLSNLELIELNIAESFSVSTPICVLTFVDSAGVFFNAKRLSHENTFTLSFGKHNIQLISLKLKIASIKAANTTVGKSEDMTYKVTFFHHGWDSMLNHVSNRSWANTRMSDVVRQIAGESNFGNIIVEDSVQTKSIIQPYTNNVTMLRYMQEEAVSEQFDDQYEFVGHIDGGFTFKTVSKMLEEQYEPAKKKQIPSMVLDDQAPVYREEERQENFMFPQTFSSYTFDTSYANANVSGGSGLRSMHYDFGSASYIVSDESVDKANFLTTTKLTSLLEQNNNKQRRYFGGRDTTTPDKSKKRIAEIHNGFNSYSIQIEGTYAARCGMLIEILIPSPRCAVFNYPYNIDYGGFYIISGVTHNINFRSGRFNTKLRLLRHGYDGDAVNHVRSAGGKFLNVQPQTR